MPTLDPRSTALVLIDLQAGILAMPLAPRSGAEVLATAKTLAGRFRTAGALVVPVRVGWAADYADAPRQPVDRPMPRPPGGLPAGWSDLVEGVAEPGDIVVTKRQWGVFTGTELDLQLRRRGVTTIVLAGIATNFGVESTARSAWELNYAVVFAEDAMTSLSAEMHGFAIESILPRIGIVSQAADIALGRS
ncbi:hydrolase [Inquilinus sp. Marseille-Q2685]|uniref:hydrolase n=1 Tax=Inquilinus sp. Marseille-Q2685 TaxID=2866581 RepID=UPI001CE3BC14|nr:hydrolase [Inquilinus sp. Marseille-Q2685]